MKKNTKGKTRKRTGKEPKKLEKMQALFDEQTKDLRESEKQYRTLFESMREGFALCEVVMNKKGKPADYRFLKINSAFAKQSGMKIKATLGKTIKEVFPDIEPIWIKRYCNVAITQKPIHFRDYNHNTKRYYDAIAFSPEKGKFAMMFRDITGRMKAEETIKESEEKFRSLFESSPEGIVAANIKTKKFVLANKAACDLMGYSKDEFLKLGMYDIHPKDKMRWILGEFTKLIQQKVKTVLLTEHLS